MANRDGFRGANDGPTPYIHSKPESFATEGGKAGDGSVWLQDPDVTLYHGDCLDVLRTLPDRSVHMVATSPPFYGLRDYGTGEWEGGNPDCDHAQSHATQNLDKYGQKHGMGGGHKASSVGSSLPYKSVCGKCGARRVDRQIGLEETPDQWVERLVDVFRECRRVLRDDGTLWIEIGDSYMANQSSGTNVSPSDSTKTGISGAPNSWAGRTNSPGKHPTKQKDLLGQPWLLAFALRADGWYLRSEIIWARPNPMPESVTDRPTKSHSTVFLLSKQARYFYDADAIREQLSPGAKIATGAWDGPSGGLHNGRAGVKPDGGVTHPAGANARSVWTIPTEPTPFAHFATWPQALVRRMILAGTSEKGCCPECGAPWVRQTETEYEHVNNTAPREMSSYVASRGEVANKRVTTTGWEPSCLCQPPGTDLGDFEFTYDPVPCTVLDPFAGSGTTCLVARNHGRHSIGIELNETYLEIARTRLQQLSLLA